MFRDEATIVALSTAAGVAALATIRLSGCDAFMIAEKCLSGKTTFRNLQVKNTALFRFLHPAEKTPIDQVTAVKHQSPASYTGEDTVEITCHGGPFIVDQILGSLLTAGARYAQPGEFTMRAFKNGKMDLNAAESVEALISSRNKLQHASAMNTYSGNYREKINGIRDGIISSTGLLEAAIEFPEDIEEKKLIRQATESLKALSEELSTELNNHSRILRIEKGITIVIAGRPNVGKSTLFNHLLKEERSLVHWQSGTTRDYVSEKLLIKGMEVTLIDTAGIRLAETEVEAKGVERSRDLLKSAHLVILTCNAQDEWSTWEEEILQSAAPSNMIGAINKCDLAHGEGLKSAMTGKGIEHVAMSITPKYNTDQFIMLLERKISDIIHQAGNPGLIINQRQEQVLRSAREQIENGLNAITAGVEVAVEYLNEALQIIDQFNGKTPTEEILNTIFSRFCIGK